jgi:CBS domain containing-hemolysin-like protein
LLEAVAGDLPDIDFELDRKVIRHEDDALRIEGSMLISSVAQLLGLRNRPPGDSSGWLRSQYLKCTKESDDIFAAQHADDTAIASDGQLIDTVAVHILEGGP